MSIHDMQQKDIEFLHTNFKRLEDTVTRGFTKLEARIELLQENYVTQKSLEKELEKKANVWTERALSRLGYTVIFVVVTALLGLVIIQTGL